jgi:hypothetical protein
MPSITTTSCVFVLREWQSELVTTIQIEPRKRWAYRHGYLLICPWCDGKLIVPLSWPEDREYQTAPCPHCFKASAVPDV